VLVARLQHLEAQSYQHASEDSSPEQSSRRLRAETELDAVKRWHFFASRKLESLTLSNVLSEFDSALADFAPAFWSMIANVARQRQRRQQRRRGRLRLWHRFRDLIYLVLSAILGVIVAAAIEHAPISGFITLVLAALTLTALDRWMITPWFERSTVRQETAIYAWSPLRAETFSQRYAALRRRCTRLPRAAD
jgi:hypothetical protein